MATFTPQRVEPQSIWLWLKEAVALCHRQPLYFIAISSSWAGIWYLPEPLRYLLLLGLPLPLAAGCLVAHAADVSRSPLDLLLSTSAKLWRDVLIAGAAPWLTVIGLIWTLSILLMPITAALGADTNVFAQLPFAQQQNWPAFRDLSAATFLWLCTVGFVGWFFVPLTAVAGLPILQAYTQTVRGLRLNWFVVGLVLFVAWICVPVLFFLSPLLIAPLLALLSSIMYVSFRHIWLGRGKNEVAREGAAEGGLALQGT